MEKIKAKFLGLFCVLYYGPEHGARTGFFDVNFTSKELRLGTYRLSYKNNPFSIDSILKILDGYMDIVSMTEDSLKNKIYYFEFKKSIFECVQILENELIKRGYKDLIFDKSPFSFYKDMTVDYGKETCIYLLDGITCIRIFTDDRIEPTVLELDHTDCCHE